MKTSTLQAQYGESTDHNLNNEAELVVKPVPEINEAFLAVNTALQARNIDDICVTVQRLALTLHLPMKKYDAIEMKTPDSREQYILSELEKSTQYIRSHWKESEDACIDALNAACMNRPESDIVIQSGLEGALLGQGTHFIEACTESENDQRGLTVQYGKGKSLTSTTDERLRARVTVGIHESVDVLASNAKLLIFSILHKPEQSSRQIQAGDPPYARYLETKDDKFLAGRHFPADMMGDPSWHELRLLPNSNQYGFEHIHPHIRLIHVTQGKGLLETGTTPDCADHNFSLAPGRLVILTPGTWHRFSTGEKGLTVQPVHPVTPTSGASANSHEMFFGTLSDMGDMLKTIQRGATR